MEEVWGSNPHSFTLQRAFFEIMFLCEMTISGDYWGLSANFGGAGATPQGHSRAIVIC